MHCSQTDIIRKAPAVPLYVIEKKCGTKKAEYVPLILGDSEFDVGSCFQEVKDIRQCNVIFYTVVRTSSYTGY